MSPGIPVSDRARSLHDWYRRPLGRALARVEQQALSKQLLNLFGYHLVIIDPPWPECDLDDSRIAHRVVQRVAPLEADTSLLADTDHWPILPDSVDAIILPHTLELASSPHQVLREADRSLVPDGHLVIIGFNPFSLWGVRQLLTRRGRPLPWGSRFRSLHRIKDWLALLGFDTLYSQYLFQRPPLQSEQLLRKLQFLEPQQRAGNLLLSACYIMVARKRSIIMTPVRDVLLMRRRVFPVGIPGPSQGKVSRVR